MKVTDLMSHYQCASKEALSAAIGYSLVTLWKWEKSGIPERTQALFQVQTNGALKADLKKSTT